MVVMMGSPGLMVKVWRKAWVARPPPLSRTLFSRQVQPAYICLPSTKLAARVGLAPTPNGLTGRRATLTLPGNGELALPAGVAPASVRLEDERLVYFGHGSV